MCEDKEDMKETDTSWCCCRDVTDFIHAFILKCTPGDDVVIQPPPFLFVVSFIYVIFYINFISDIIIYDKTSDHLCPAPPQRRHGAHVGRRSADCLFRVVGRCLL